MKGSYCIKKVFSCVTALALVLGVSGCKQQAQTSAGGDGEIPKEVSIFCGRSASLTEDMQDYNDVLGFQMMEEATGCHVNWTLPPASGGKEKFNLMIASGKFTDCIVYAWENVAVKQYAEDGVIIPLTDLIEEYMPNFARFCEEHPDYKKEIVADDGEIYSIPYIRTDPKLNVFVGPQIRTDWLEKLNLEVPETADELYEVLKAFKTQDPNGNGIADEIPMTGIESAQGAYSLLNLLWMFDTSHGFYVDGNEVKYGLQEPNFDEGLRYVTKLFSEGLIDPDYILQDRTKMDGKVTNNQAGFFYSYQPTKISNTMAKIDPSFKLEGIGHFKNSEGVRKCMLKEYADKVLGGTSLAISTSNPNPEGTAKWLDWVFSDEGTMAMNFGRENETYTMKDGEPVFTDLIINNPDGSSVTTTFSKCSAVFNSYFPALQDWRSYSQSLSPYGLKAIETWADGVDTSNIIPGISLSSEEQEKVSSIMSQIETYTNEKMDKIILGQESIDTLPDIRTKISEMGIEEVLSIYQDALDRYNSK